MQIELSGKSALVTGASGELGRVMARTLARCGADVGVHYHRNETKAREVCDEIESMGRRAIAVGADVASRDEVFAMRDKLKEPGIVPDIVVCNAVAQYPWKNVLEQPVEDYEEQFRLCVLQNVLLAQAFVPAMQQRNWGRIVAISTECAMQCAPNQSAYVSGKRGMDGVLRVLAREVGAQNITVNQVAPGWTISDRDRAAGTQEQEKYAANVPLRRRGTDEDIANAVAWLASDLADFISGAWLPVCGGTIMPTI